MKIVTNCSKSCCNMPLTSKAVDNRAQYIPKVPLRSWLVVMMLFVRMLHLSGSINPGVLVRCIPDSAHTAVPLRLLHTKTQPFGTVTV